MPNWCSTAYAIEGNATELKKLYELMKDLEKRQKPSSKWFWNYVVRVSCRSPRRKLGKDILPWNVG